MSYMKRQFVIFIVRWLLNSLGLWVAVRLLGTGYSDNTMVSVGLVGFLTAGLIFSIVNSIIKPFIVILSLPAILVTLGLFMLIVNGLMVYISLWLVPGISMTFFNSILTGMLLSLVNYIVSATFVVQSRSAK
jgi:putative membrane protein